VTDDLAAYLCGRWGVDRVVRDGEARGAFAGTAEFSPTGARAELLWDEAGELRLAGYEGPARRRLHLVPDGEGWEVRFDDGRPFHPLDLREGRCAAAHDCGADRYEGEYVIRGPDAFDVVWRVRGPAKDQEIVSRYRRA
jgi:hypothetical protein